MGGKGENMKAACSSVCGGVKIQIRILSVMHTISQNNYVFSHFVTSFDSVSLQVEDVVMLQNDQKQQEGSKQNVQFLLI